MGSLVPGKQMGDIGSLPFSYSGILLITSSNHSLVQPGRKRRSVGGALPAPVPVAEGPGR